MQEMSHHKGMFKALEYVKLKIEYSTSISVSDCHVADWKILE